MPKSKRWQYVERSLNLIGLPLNKPAFSLVLQNLRASFKSPNKDKKGGSHLARLCLRTGRPSTRITNFSVPLPDLRCKYLKNLPLLVVTISSTPSSSPATLIYHRFAECRFLSRAQHVDKSKYQDLPIHLGGTPSPHQRCFR